MTIELPHEFAAPDLLRWSNPGAFVSGGVSSFGEDHTRRTDGGGAWVASLSQIPLLTEASARTMEALLLRFSLGDTKVIVPRCAGRLKAAWARESFFVPHSDETTHSDGTPYESGPPESFLDDAIVLRATTAVLRLPEGAALLGGEPFSLTGPTYGKRLYGVASVLDVSGDLTTVLFGPPAREAYAAETEADFWRPGCTMRAKMAQGDPWPEYDTSWNAFTSMVFRETFT